MVCEGEVTEPSYLKGFCRFAKNALVEVTVADRQGVPRTVVEIGKELKNKAADQARRENDDNLKFDRVWCVFDVDNHPHIDQARTMAGDNDIHLAISNPNFELWLLLHLQDSPGTQERSTIRNLLKKRWPKYDKAVNFNQCEDGYLNAVSRATKLDELAAAIGEEGKNPSTGVYRLTEEIRLGVDSRRE